MSLRFARRLFAIAIVLALRITTHAQSSGPFSVDEVAARLSFSGDHFLLELPIVSKTASPAEITVDLLDVDNTVRSHTKSSCNLTIGRMICHAEMPPATVDTKHIDHQEEHISSLRVRYTVATVDASPLSGTLAIDHIAPELFELHVAAPGQIHPGQLYSVRVRALHPLTHAPRANVTLTAALTASYEEMDKKDTGFAHENLVTDADGFATLSFTVPRASDLTSLDLNLDGHLANLHLGTTQTLEVPENARLELTTDKPLYQPGQTVHTRLLLLDHSGHASAGKDVRLDVLDPDYILVFRAEANTSNFGIATLDWPVPARMRLGEYSLRASVINDENSGQGAAATLRLSRYDLPGFVVAPKPDRSFYLPGENAIVDVRANYLFGKPVLRGHVRVVREEDRTWNFNEQRYNTKESKSVSGELDADGSFRAHIDLADDESAYQKQPGSNEFEDLHFAAYVTDASTGRTEQRRFDIRITSQGLHLYLSGQNRQVKGLPEQLYLAVTTADGTPTECDLSLSLLPQATKHNTLAQRIERALPLQHLHTDSHGLARINLDTWEELQRRTPAAPAGSPSIAEDLPTIRLTARDTAGRTGAQEMVLPEPVEALRITTGKALYRPGDSVDVTVEAASFTSPALPVTVQLLRHTRHGDILLATRDITLAKGRASLSCPTDRRFSGFVFVNAFSLGTNTQEEDRFNRNYRDRDPRTLMVARALLFPRDNALKVDIHMSRESYAPGDEATAALTVHGPQDPDGEDSAPAPSALGIVAVDQAVEERNRTDNDFSGPGTQPFFFRWNPEYEVRGEAGGFTLDSLQQIDTTKPLPPELQLAAEILLQGHSLPFDTASNTGVNDLATLFKPALDAQLSQVRVALARYLDTHTELPTTEPELATLLEAQHIDLLLLRDPWGTPYTLTSKAESDGTLALNLHSNGPDKLPGTADDFDIDLADWHWFNGHERELKHITTSYHQRTGSFIRDLATLRREMQAANIGFDQWRDPWGQPFVFSFSIEQTNHVIEVRSLGAPRHPSEYDFGPYLVGSVHTDYTSELKQRIEAALNRYAASHPYPTTDAQLSIALRAAGVDSTQMVDPWHHPLYATFRKHSFFTDRIHVETHAAPASSPQTRTTVTPITAISDMIDLRSAGPDGKRNTPDDFTFASFTRVRSQQDAHESTARALIHPTVHSGPTGDLTGTLTDSTGAVIPGVTVIATDQITKAAYEQKTDENGQYLLGPVPAGTYKVQFSASGFMDFVYDQVVVLAQNSTVLDAKLNVGTVSEAVEVTASAPVLNSESASIAAGRVSDLPPPSYLLTRPAMLMRISPGATSRDRNATPRLRDYFPETLLWRPEIVTAEDGTATLHFPVADNITTWQLSAAASTLQGNTGSGTAQFRTFQPFFAAFDPPRFLTVGDTIALPITLRNYLDRSLEVRSELIPASWFKASDSHATTQVPAQDSASPVFRFTATTPALDAQQQFSAQASEVVDRIARPVTVHPNGEEVAVTASGILSAGDTTFTLTLPADTLPSSSDATLKLYPNLAAHLRDALTAMDAYPNGCAEQILSIAWPSLLLQRYAAAIPHKDEKLQTQTLTRLQEAYENILANQRNGGFAYWPSDRAPDLALTAYAIQFLTQARKYISIDDTVLNNAVTYLAHQQQSNGLWLRIDRDQKPHPEDSNANAMLTASIAAMIVGAPNTEPLLKKALSATQTFAEEFDEPYTLANYALTALALQDTARSAPALARLRTLSLSENGGVYWKLETNTPFFGWGRAGRVESTAQVLSALLAGGATPQDDLITRGLLFLDHEQDRNSLWYSTQATARALDVLAAIALRTPVAPLSDFPGSLSVRLDSRSAVNVPLPPATQDSGPIFVPLGADLGSGPHRITLILPQGAESATAQIVANLYRPWQMVAPTSSTTNNEQLRLTVFFNEVKPLPGKPIEATAHIERLGFRGYGMMIAEIGLPPGTDVDRASLESAVAASGYQINHYEVLPDRLQFYVWPNPGGIDLRFRFTLRYAIDALTAPSTVYDYYNPDARFNLPPAHFVSR